MATFYLVIVPQGVTPTWSRSNIATNSGWTATTIAYHDADTDPGTGSTYVFTPDASGLTAGTPYDLWVVWDDGATTVGPVQGTGFETAAAGITGSLSAVELSTDTSDISGAVLISGSLSSFELGSDTASFIYGELPVEVSIPISVSNIGYRVKVIKALITMPVSASLISTKNNLISRSFSGTRDNPY